MRGHQFRPALPGKVVMCLRCSHIIREHLGQGSLDTVLACDDDCRNSLVAEILFPSDTSVIPDDVFANDGDGELTSFELPPPTEADVESIALGMRRVFQIDALVCPSCQGTRRILAAITEREPIDKILTHLGLSTEVPVVEKAGPPAQGDFAFD